MSSFGQKRNTPRRSVVTTSHLQFHDSKKQKPNLQVFDILERWNFVYVENMAWIKIRPNNTFEMQDARYFRKSKLTMLIFKKNTAATKDLELKHQRSPDLWFDFVRHRPSFVFLEQCDVPHSVRTVACRYLLVTADGREEKPNFQYELIETLLPSIEPLRMLELLSVL